MEEDGGGEAAAGPEAERALEAFGPQGSPARYDFNFGGFPAEVSRVFSG